MSSSRTGARSAAAVDLVQHVRPVVVLLALLAAAACAPGTADERTASPAPPAAVPASAPAAPEGPARLLVTTPTGDTVIAEIAATPEERARGLMFRSSVPRGTGMYFIFPSPEPHTFWMLNCLVPLDIAWLDADNRVIYVAEEVPVCPREPCPSYGPPTPASAVLEVGAGEARRTGIRPGARLLVQRIGQGAR